MVFEEGDEVGLLGRGGELDRVFEENGPEKLEGFQRWMASSKTGGAINDCTPRTLTEAEVPGKVSWS